ncbi:MAG: TonB-dependent siderophore receptor [Luteibacter sp.]|uniref:TonB-dependent receptor n=1 Tax=Luteibacter sp. TaxID=1886636 RepID=UPI002806A98E|nr:TonB-dependent siderophore receptor [Luteibacter sp.]MDQ7995283.1 TonB-dependent siderophore receptor [Luteibacter sp.]
MNVLQMNGRFCVRRTVLACALLMVETAHAQSTTPVDPSTGPTSLDAVKVSATAVDAAYAGGQIARGGSLGILGTASTLDTPFSTVNYTSEMLRNQQARTLADVVVNEASVRTLTSSGGFGEDFQIRGYTVTSGDVGLDGLYGLASASRMPAALMERVEVLKGPGTLMYGIGPSGSIGGAINIVTKRAPDAPLTRITPTFQSDAQVGLQADVARRFGATGAWGVRFNGVYADGETGIDHGSQRPSLGAVAVDYRSDRLRWTLDAYDQREHTRDFRPQVGFQATNTALPKLPDPRDNYFPNTQLALHDSTVATRLEYDLAPSIMVYGAAGYRYGTASQTFPSGAVDTLGRMKLLNAYYDSYSRTKTEEVGLRWQFATGSVEHRLAVAATFLEQEAGNAYVTSGVTVPSSLYDPSPLPPITLPRNAPRKASNTTLSSFSLVDTVSLADGRLLFTAGLRSQRVALDSYATATGLRTSAYDERAVSPLAGVVLKVLSNVSLYANFTAGLSRGGTAPASAANAGQVFAPYKSKQYEAGVKADWGQFGTTVSVFQVARPNAVTDPATNVYSFDGRQRNRGLELSTFGELSSDLRLLASATFYEAELQHTAGGLNDGHRANGVPKRNFNLGLDWDVPGVAGLALTGRAISSSSVYFNPANTISVPGWTRFDGGARYATRIGGKPVTFRANVENLFDRHFWLLSGTYATVAAGRTYLASAQIDL